MEPRQWLVTIILIDGSVKRFYSPLAREITFLRSGEAYGCGMYNSDLVVYADTTEIARFAEWQGVYWE